MSRVTVIAISVSAGIGLAVAVLKFSPGVRAKVLGS